MTGTGPDGFVPPFLLERMKASGTLALDEAIRARRSATPTAPVAVDASSN